MWFLRKLRKTLEAYLSFFFFFFPTASSQGKVDRIILPKQSSDMKELTKKSALSQGKGNLNDFS